MNSVYALSIVAQIFIAGRVFDSFPWLSAALVVTTIVVCVVVEGAVKRASPPANGA